MVVLLTIQQANEHGTLGDFIGPDSYLRMVRVSDLAANLDWYDNVIERLAPPQGMDIHWTRPHDVLILSLAALAAPFAGWETGIYLAGMMISPLLMLATVFAFYWAIQGLFRPRHGLFPSAALFLLPAVEGYGRLGRPDHHSLLLFMMVLSLGLAVRTYIVAEGDRRAIWLGVALGFGLWLSVELLFVLVGIGGYLALLWVWSPAERFHQNRDLSLALLSTLVLAVMIESRPAEWLQPAFDKISIVQIMIGVLLAAFWWLIGVLQRLDKLPQSVFGRIVLGSFAVAVFSLTMELIFPGFFKGPMGQVHAGATDLLTNTSEMRTLLQLSTNVLSDLFSHFLMPFIAIGYGFYALRQPRDADRQKAFIGAFVLLIFATVLAAVHFRFSIYMQVLSLIFIAHLLDRMFTDYEYWSFGRLNGIVAGIAAIMVLFGGMITNQFYLNYFRPNGSSPAVVPICSAKLVADELRTWSAAPQTILAPIDHGPELLYRTPHSFVAAPYHRNGQAISDHREMLRGKDDRSVIELLNRYQVDAILLCPDPGELHYYGADQPGTLYYRISHGEAPGWIGPDVLAGSDKHDFKLFPVHIDHSNPAL